MRANLPVHAAGDRQFPRRTSRRELVGISSISDETPVSANERGLAAVSATVYADAIIVMDAAATGTAIHQGRRSTSKPCQAPLRISGGGRGKKVSSVSLHWLELSSAQGHAVLFAQGDSFAQMLPLMMIIGVLFYFMILRPETRRRSEQEQLNKGLKKNDRVITIGGIYGTVVNAPQDQDDITIKVDESTNTRLRITRSSIQTVLKDKESDKKGAG
jgi:preprotein translocase subunit YajC